MTIYKKVLELNIEHDTHYSDLYIPVNDTTRALIKQFNCSPEVFTSEIDASYWYDIPFAYDDFYNKRGA